MRNIPSYLKEELNNLGITTRIVEGFDEEKYEVPRHINKIPTGWQVRFARKGEPYFSCAFANNNYGGADNALDEAILCLLDEQKNHKLTDFLEIGNKDGVKISFAKTSRIDNGVPCYSASVTLLHQRNGSLSVASRYLGTKNTLTQERLDTAVKELLGAWYWAKTMKEEIGRRAFSEISKKIPENAADYLPQNFKIPSYSVGSLLN
ncbi:hypothetical protein HJ167_20490 [Vibrio parahaemolyticus]|uniref:hypothetical protein n=1 Tax=Vibrio parahaemolyticus TaxID=670 RepID=UPI0033457B88|nr:hypothetical protein [Vibrio parahaemolyticus]MDG3410438.1 hypothetical protein [Vibrio parahaemolyticus]